MKIKQFLVVLAILGVGAGVVAYLFASQSPQELRSPDIPLPSVRVQAVERGPVALSVRAHGTVAPRTESDLVPQVSGPVVWVSPALASGGFFDRDAPLVRIDPADYEVELESQRAAVARAEAERVRATKELDRQKRLADQSVSRETSYDDAIQREKVSDAALREARARLDRAQRDLARTEIRAPYTGRVRSTDVGEGQYVTVGSPIAKIYAVDYAEVRLPVPDADLRFLDLPSIFRGNQLDELGPEVTLRAHFAGAERIWHGNIVRTEGEIDPKTRMVHVVARVEDPYGRLGVGTDDDTQTDTDGVRAPGRPPLAVGLFVDAEISGRRLEDAVILPRSALQEGDRVVVVDKERKLHRRPVEVIRRERDRVILGAGLHDGEDVMVSSLNAIVEGMAVQLTSEPSEHAGGREGPR